MEKTKDELKRLKKIKYQQEYRKKNKEKIAAKKKEKYTINREDILEKKKQHRVDNLEAEKKRVNEYRNKNKDQINKLQREARAKNPEKYRAKNKKHWEENREKLNSDQRKRHATPEAKAKRKEYEKNNAEKIQKTRKKYSARKTSIEKNRMKTDFNFRTNKLMSKAFRNMLLLVSKPKNGRKWLSYVDYSIDELVLHLKKSLIKLNKYSDKKYKWDDYLLGKLHIDHILPKSKFKFDSPDHPEFKRCWSLENLQLLPALENHKKGAKCDNFQHGF